MTTRRRRARHTRRRLPERPTVDQLSAFLGIDRKSTYRALERGEIPGRRVGRRWIISGPAVEAWLKGEPRSAEA